MSALAPCVSASCLGYSATLRASAEGRDFTHATTESAVDSAVTCCVLAITDDDDVLVRPGKARGAGWLRRQA